MDADAILTRYRHYRELTMTHANAAMARVSSDTLVERARQIGLARGKSLVCDDQEWPLVCDLALYTAPAGRSRAVDRYAKAALAGANGDDADVLRAMAASRFSIWTVVRHHDTTGVILSDMIQGDEVWLVDEAFGFVAKPGWISAMRLLPVAEFVITAGTMVPLNGAEMAEAVIDQLPWATDDNKHTLRSDPRFPVAVYRTALEYGVLNRVRYRQMDEALPLPEMRST